MTEGGGNPAGHDRPRQPFIRSYDAPTTPMPRVRPEDLRTSPPVTPPPGAAPAPARGAGRRAGDLPLRLFYTVVAAVGAIIAVALVFLVFSGDKPGHVAPVHQAQAGATGPASPTPSVSPTPAPVALPKVPASYKYLPVYPGQGTSVVSYVLDKKAGISYPKFGKPWKTADPAPFALAQRAGPARLPQALIGSGPLPGAAPGTLSTYRDYRKLAAKAARWTLRHQPPGGKLTWTASQPVRRGMGWLLGYKVSYVSGGVKHSSQAIVAVVGTGRTRPAMLFATVPDDRKELLHDLNMLFWTARPISA
ncbi:hypothetical protein [Planotetraspora sp. GP83]|uniref:hypothetical protein n=1 Tax=Planotetraspora sp. GP83 TaxID=3156264 RepID=UPI003512B9DF